MSDQSVPISDNHDLCVPDEPEVARRPQEPRWPLLGIIVAVMIILALITTAIWIGFLGWLAVKLLAWLFT